MSVQVRWYDEAQSIVLYTFHPEWTWAQFYPAFEEALAMEHSKTHRVDVMVDYQLPYMIPPGLLDNLRIIAARQPTNVKLSVLVTRQHAAIMMLRAAGNIIPVVRDWYRVAVSIPEAVSLIERDRKNDPSDALGNR